MIKALLAKARIGKIVGVGKMLRGNSYAGQAGIETEPDDSLHR